MRLPRSEAGPLVPRMRDGAGRRGAGVRRYGLARCVRMLSGDLSAAGLGGRSAGRRARLIPGVDDDAVDAARERRGRRAPGADVRAAADPAGAHAGRSGSPRSDRARARHRRLRGGIGVQRGGA